MDRGAKVVIAVIVAFLAYLIWHVTAGPSSK